MRKKVLLITADQWRGDALRWLGHPAAHTPNLDALAADGVTFCNHFTNAAPCGPARATLLTGLYPHLHRSVRNGTPLDARHTNLALEARKAGREPVLIGYTDSSVDPRTVGPFDARLRNYEGFLPGFQVVATLNMDALADWLSELSKRGYDIPDHHFDIYTHDGQPAVMERFSRAPARYRADDSDTAFIADRLIDHLRCRQGQDWFVHAVFFRPHPPLIAPAPFNEMIDTARLPQPKRHSTRDAEFGQHPFLGAWSEEQNSPDYFSSQINVHAVPEADRAAMRAVYFGLIAEVDRHVGRVIAHLKGTGEYDETLILFTSDHGEMLGDHWLWGKGGWYDAAYHVPLIIRAPGLSQGCAGRRVEAFTESVDLMPTVLSWLGADIPAQLSGLDLSPWLVGETPAAWRSHVFWEYDFRDAVSQRYEQELGLTSDQCTLNVIRDRTHKYVHFTDLPPLFYDVVADPHELHNLADEAAHQATVGRYARKFLSHRMLHAERTLTNTMLTADGLVEYDRPRGFNRC